MITKVVVGSAAGCIAALAMAFYLVARDLSPVSVGVLSVLFGLILGAAAVFWARRRLQRERVLGLENLSEAQGLLIWVRVRSPEKEAQAQEILMRHGGKAVHVHEIELTKRTEDLPLHSLRPDPWLGDERLGQP
jgi:membrane protein DedA with SNARE-associated domain